jgi:hypothetical protein
MRHILLVSFVLAVSACGDDDGGGGIPGNPGTDITVDVIPEVELAANGGTPYVGFVAYQDGDAAWQAMEEKDGQYRARILSESYGVAIACAQHPLPGINFSVASVTVYHRLVTDATELSDFGCVELLKPQKLTGSAAGLPPGKSFLLGTGQGSSNTSVRASGFSVDVFAGPVDLVAYDNGGSPATSRVLRLSGIDPTQTTPPLVLNFDQSVVPVTFPVTAPASAAPIYVSGLLRNKEGGRYLQLSSPVNQLVYSTVPRALLRDGDLLRVGITSTQPGVTQDSFLYLAEPGPASLEFGPAFRPAAPTLVRDPGPRATFVLGDDVGSLPQVSYRMSTSTRTASSLTVHQIELTQAWLQKSGATSYQMPDLRSLAGWQATLELGAGLPVRWEIARDEQSESGFVPNKRVRVNTVSGELAN